MKHLTVKSGSIVATVLLVLFAIAISFGASSPQVYAQDATNTPSDPGWLAFSAVRDAIEEAFGISLRPVVQRWDYEQQAWDTPAQFRDDRAFGIDACDTSVHIADGRPIYWGFYVQIRALNGKTYGARISFDLQDIAICDEELIPLMFSGQGGVESAIVDDSGDAPANPDVAAPVTGPATLTGFQLGGQVLGDFSAEVDQAMRQAQMIWVKRQVNNNYFGYDAGNGFIAEAKAKGYRILLSVVATKEDIARGDVFFDEFAQILAGFAAAGADAIEVHNEANIDREWPADQISGANYVRMLAKAYNAIKEANSATIVSSGALAPTGFWGTAGCGQGGCNDDVFMQQMAAAGAAQYMDCVGLHYNEGIISPQASSGDPRGSYPTYFFGSMTARGKSPFGNKPICYTEIGYLTPEGMGGPLPGGFAWAQNTTVAQQAQWLGQAVDIMQSRGDVAIAIIWNMNSTSYTGSDPQGGYAIIRPDRTCPACGTLGAAMAS